jgi:hypothetical protein
MGKTELEYIHFGRREDIKEILCESVDWIQLAENKDQWRIGVNMGMNLRVL